MYASEAWTLFNRNGGRFLKEVSFSLAHFQELEVFVNTHLAAQKQSPSLRLSLKDLNCQLRALKQEDGNGGSRAVCFCVLYLAYRIMSDDPGSACLLDSATFHNKHPQYVQADDERYTQTMLLLCNLMIVASMVLDRGNKKDMVMEVVATICGNNVKFKTGGGKDSSGERRMIPALYFYEKEFLRVPAGLNVQSGGSSRAECHMSPNIVGAKRSGSFDTELDESRERHCPPEVSGVTPRFDKDEYVQSFDFDVLQGWLAEFAKSLSATFDGPTTVKPAMVDGSCFGGDYSSYFPPSPGPTEEFSDLLDATDGESEFSALSEDTLCLWTFDGFEVSDSEEQALLNGEG